MAEKIALERLSVLPDRIEAEVRVLDPAYRTTSPELIAQVLIQFPYDSLSYLPKRSGAYLLVRSWRTRRSRTCSSIW